VHYFLKNENLLRSYT